MNKKIFELIEQEDKRNPLTDEEIARRLGVLREVVTNIRRQKGIPDSRQRRKDMLKEDITGLLRSMGPISERRLTTELNAKGYGIGKYAVSRLKREVEEENGNLSAAYENKKPLHITKREESEQEKESANTESVFSRFIGCEGSMKTQIDKAQAALLYPPKGLHTLIFGPSGVGKSFLAELMHQYALRTDNFDAEAPFVEFNCADYADNPQLLLAQLFGYAKGAFTGASENKKGLVELCDGGILFLDEVHRLPPEGQEILFYLIDKGRFRRLGEADTQRKTNIMMIAATTENPESALLLTFRRRIPMCIEIRALKDRPLEEKMEFIKLFFLHESRRLGQALHVESDAIKYLLSYDCPGNVGQLKSDIQVSCAKAFLEAKLSLRDKIYVTAQDLSESIRSHTADVSMNRGFKDIIKGDTVFSPDNSMAYDENKKINIDDGSIYAIIDSKYSELKQKGFDDSIINTILTKEVEKELVRNAEEPYLNELSRQELCNIVGQDILKLTNEVYLFALKRLPDLSSSLLFPLAIHLSAVLDHLKNNKRIRNTNFVHIKDLYLKEYEVSLEIVQLINQKIYKTLPREEATFIAMYLKNFQNNKSIREKKIGVLVVSHGRVACGMAEVANRILNVNHAIGLEMSLTDAPSVMLEKIISVVSRIDQGKGCIILADMGSLLSFEEAIEEKTGVKVMVVGRVDTLMVLECLRKVLLTEETIESIAQELDIKNYPLVSSALSGVPRKKAILCLCITGQGSAKVIEELLYKRLESSIQFVDIITKGYIENEKVENIIAEVEKSYEIIAAVGTIDPCIPRIPFIPIETIYEFKGISRLRSIVKKHTAAVKNDLSEVLPLEFIFTNTDFRYKDQVIDAAVEKMVENGYVDKEYLLSVYKREAVAPTFLKGGIAIPHGESRFITKPVIAVTKLDNPVSWDGTNSADIIFTLALEENSKKYFEQLYAVISHEDSMEGIRKAENEKEIADILYGVTIPAK